MLAAQPPPQVSPINSLSPPCMVKLGFPESSQPVQWQTGTHGVVDGGTGGGLGVVVGGAVVMVVDGGLGVGGL